MDRKRCRNWTITKKNLMGLARAYGIGLEDPSTPQKPSAPDSTETDGPAPDQSANASNSQPGVSVIMSAMSEMSIMSDPTAANLPDLDADWEEVHIE